MENLSLNDPPGQRGPQSQQPPQQPPPHLASQAPPQLPPQMFTTAAQLLDLTDKKLMVALRDGRKLIGVLRSWDQFANLVLQNTIERIYAGHLYADIPRGLFLVRGENVTLLGEIDLDTEDEPPKGFQQAEPEKVSEMKQQEEQIKKRKAKSKQTLLRKIGFEGEGGGEALI